MISNNRVINPAKKNYKVLFVHVYLKLNKLMGVFMIIVILCIGK